MLYFNELEQKELIDILNRLPQKNITNKRDTYLLTIIRNERDENENAWIIMYVKENCKSLSTSKIKMKVEGGTILEALCKMEIA
jgi:hypothetical protein